MCDRKQTNLNQGTLGVLTSELLVEMALFCEEVAITIYIYIYGIGIESDDMRKNE